MLFLIDMKGLIYFGSIGTVGGGQVPPVYKGRYGNHLKTKSYCCYDMEWEANNSFIKDYLEWEKMFRRVQEALKGFDDTMCRSEPPKNIQGYYVVVCPD